jgi:DNA-binding transcriptional regulator YbjK
MQTEEITFQGRKTARQGSEQRRLAILQAALRVVVRDGVRGVRHRAVAKEADVPLSATTYYFKDIHDLLADAFTLYAQETIDTLVSPFWNQALEWVTGKYSSAENVRGRPEQLGDIIDHMADAGAEYILQRITVYRERILIEHAFLYAALQDERLHTMAVQHSRRLGQSLTQLLEMVNIPDAELAAISIIGTVRRLEYEAVMSQHPDKAAIKRALVHQVKAVTRL